MEGSTDDTNAPASPEALANTEAAAAIARAAEQASVQSLAIVRAVFYGILWTVGALGILVVGDSIPTFLQEQSGLQSLLVIGIIIAGFAVGLSPSLRLRRALSTLIGSFAGAVFGYGMERLEGALITAPIVGVTVFLLLPLLEKLILLIRPVWRLMAIWAVIAASIASVLLAILIRLAIGRIDDDDIAFYGVASFLAIAAAHVAGWTADGDLSWRNIGRRALSALRLLLYPRVLPFIIALFVASAIAGPVGQRLEVVEGDTTIITTALHSYAWPAAFTIAAITAIVIRLGTAATTFRKGMIALILWCIYCLINYALLHVKLSEQQIELRLSIWGSHRFERGQVQKISYERRTGRRTVSYDPVFHLNDGETVTIASSAITHRTVEWMRDRWGVTEESWRNMR